MSSVLVLSINTSWNLLNFRQGLIRSLQAEGYRIVTLAPVDASTSNLRALGCEVIEFPIASQGTNPLQDIHLWWRYRQHLRRLRPMAYLGWTIKPNIYGSLAAHSLGIPVINNISGLGTTFLVDGWLSRLSWLLYRVALSRSQRVFFQNTDDQALFIAQSLVRAEQAALLPGSGIDLQHFQLTAREPVQSRSFRFLLVARMLRDKGVIEFVEAARTLRAQGLEIECQCLGFLDVANPSAISREQMQAWVDEGIVTYLGSTSDVRPYIALADCIVLPSYREGTPRALLEAAAMGRPLIATDVPGCRDVVAHEVNGLLCQPRSSVALAEAMRQMSALPLEAWQRMADAGRHKMEAEYDESLVITSYKCALSGF